MKKEAFAAILLLFLILLALAGEGSARLSAAELTALTERSESLAASGHIIGADRLLKAASESLRRSTARIYLPDSALSELQQQIYSLRRSLKEGSAGLSLEYEALRDDIVSCLRLGMLEPDSIFTRYFCRLGALKAHP